MPTKKTNAPCHHCGTTANSDRRRGLCRRCWRDECIRDRYPVRPRGTPFRKAVDKPCDSCGGPTWRQGSAVCRRCYLKNLAAARRRACRHCAKVTPHPRSGLCWKCYHTPGVRELHPADRSKVGTGEVKDFYGGYRPADRPTASLPGTAERVEEYARRAAAGVGLFHPADPTAKPGAGEGGCRQLVYAVGEVR